MVSSCPLDFQESVPGGCPSGGHLPRYKHHHGLLSFQDVVPQTPLPSAVSAPRSFHAISECSQLRAGSCYWPSAITYSDTVESNMHSWNFWSRGWCPSTAAFRATWGELLHTAIHVQVWHTVWVPACNPSYSKGRGRKK